ncbi:MAG: SufD family Fe-S cluster assembly protein [Bacteroidales bacterium]|nr:SufD family Fe-S cluster assembly protein [Bacteroidales bacterium]
MEYIKNIYDYESAEIVATSHQTTQKTIIAQSNQNHSVKLSVTAQSHSTLELHICNIIDHNSSIRYDIDVAVEDNCNVTLSVISIAGNNVDVNINVNITGENSTVNLPGLMLPSQDESFTYHSHVTHAVGLSNTTQKVRTVADLNGYGDFFGIIKVNPDAQKSITEQVNNNILLSEDARIESKPQLEIYADDVKCAHGSTTGMLDQDAIFYMRSRGISEKTAQNLLLQAFIDEVVDSISTDAEYIDYVKGLISHKLYA